MGVFSRGQPGSRRIDASPTSEQMFRHHCVSLYQAFCVRTQSRGPSCSLGQMIQRGFMLLYLIFFGKIVKLILD